MYVSMASSACPRALRRWGQGGHQPHVPAQEAASTVRCCLGAPTHGCLWGPAKPCLYLPFNGPVNRACQSPAQSQGRTDTSQGSELPLAGLPQTNSLQRASVLQACRCSTGHQPRLEPCQPAPVWWSLQTSAGQPGPPYCFPQTA